MRVKSYVLFFIRKIVTFIYYLRQLISMKIENIIQNVEKNCNVHIFVDNDDDFNDCAYYIPEANAIGINPNISDNEAIASIIHEVAHHVDISENNNERREIDEEIIAFAVEEIVFHNAPVQGVIGEVEQDIRDSYQFNGVVSVDEDDIVEVAERVKIICNIF